MLVKQVLLLTEPARQMPDTFYMGSGALNSCPVLAKQVFY